jgi:hypothetical protein
MEDTDMKIARIQLSEIIRGENVRLPNHYNLPPLVADIEMRGITEPITVGVIDGQYELARGFRRVAAVECIKERNPVAYEKHFSNGIPAVVHDPCTTKELLELKVDDGTKLVVSDPHEVQKCANLLFEAGKTEKEVAVEIASLIDQVAPMKPEVRREIVELREKAEAHRKNGKIAESDKADADADDRLFDYRHGFVQNLHNAARCPDIVMATLYAKATGEAPEGFEDEDLPTSAVTSKTVTKLYKAFREDLLDNPDGSVSKAIPGRNFTEAWNKVCATHTGNKAKSPKESRAKAMSAKDMKEEIGNYRSRLAQTITRKHAGDKDVDSSRLSTDDRISFYAELVHASDKNLWKQIEQKAKAEEKRLNAERKKAAAEAEEKEQAEAGAEA